MRKIYLILLFSLLGISLSAQENEPQDGGNQEFRTIFGGKKIGGYGGISIGYSQIDGYDAVTLGARGAVVLGHYLALGAGGRAFANAYHNEPTLNQQVNLVGGYGGFFAEPIFFPKSPVHLSFPVMAGLGGVAFTTWIKNDFSATQSNVNETSVYLFVEPAVELEFNLTRFFRVSGYLSYRFTSSIMFRLLHWKITMQGLSLNLENSKN